MWSKWHFFDFFSKTALTILTKLAQKVELINSEHLPKTACPKKFPFSRYSSTKLRFWPKNVNLIFGIDDKFPFLYVSSDFHLLVVFMEKNGPQNGQISMHFLSGFRPFSRQPLEIFRRNLVRSETKWIQSRCKRPETFILSHSGDI